jgi:hypothetical protein
MPEHVGQYYGVCALLEPNKDERLKYLAQGDAISKGTPRNFVFTLHYLRPCPLLSEVKYDLSTLPVEFENTRRQLLHSLGETVRAYPEQKKEALEWYETVANDVSAHIEERAIASHYAASILNEEHSPAAPAWIAMEKKLYKLVKKEYATPKKEDATANGKGDDDAGADKSQDKEESPDGTGKDAVAN